MTVVQSGSLLSGEITIQPSKSYLHRLIILSGLMGKTIKIKNVNYSDDINATLDCMKNLGLIDYVKNSDSIDILKGNGQLNGTLNCNESGSTLRFMIPLALTMGESVTLCGKTSLMNRPLGLYENLCKDKGFEFTRNGDTLTVNGNLNDTEYTLPCDVSSQFITGILLSMVKNRTCGKITLSGKIESRGYIEITLDVMNMFGIRTSFVDNVIVIEEINDTYMGEEIFCQGDWSHAGFYACYGALNGGVTLKGLNLDSKQGDSKILSVLKNMGADFEITKDNDIVFRKANLLGIEIDGKEIPDIVPILSMASCLAKGKTRIYNIGRLRFKECDRLNATMECLNKIGGNVEIIDDELHITPVTSFTGGEVTVYNDHRMCMTMAIASCFSTGDIVVDNKDCVKKSAPDFWNEYTKLGGRYV